MGDATPPPRWLTHNGFYRRVSIEATAVFSFFRLRYTSPQPFRRLGPPLPPRMQPPGSQRRLSERALALSMPYHCVTDSLLFCLSPHPCLSDCSALADATDHAVAAQADAVDWQYHLSLCVFFRA